MRRLYFFVALNRPWQLIKTLKTKFWLQKLTQLTLGIWWIDMSHLASVFPCNFAFIFKLQMYKEAITGEFICSWQNLLWTTKTWRYSILSFIKIENCWRLKLLKFTQILVTVLVIISSDIIFRFAVFCFTNIVSSVKFSWAKNRKTAIWRKLLTLELELNDNLSEAYLELNRTSMMELFVKTFNG